VERLVAEKRKGGMAGFQNFSTQIQSFHLHPPLTKRGWPIFLLSRTLFGEEGSHKETTPLGGKAGEGGKEREGGEGGRGGGISS